ncbi:MAG TPA: hypothetical protein VK551_00150 [Thermodesulfobacteriota bacterium]|nr:hypothetical protein [Thermodesulfobacteriota bacterium]
MKRFLILFSLIAFLTVSCAGPNKVGWRRLGNDFRQDKFEEDRQSCIQIIDQDLHSGAFGLALDECLAWEGYKYGSISSKQVQKKKGEWGKPDFSQVQFEKDQEECKQIISNDIEHPVTVAECLAKKGYKFELSLPDNKKGPNKVLTVLVFSAALVLAVGLMVASRGRASPLLWAAGMSPPKD